jgi:hypothetical protein
VRVDVPRLLDTLSVYLPRQPTSIYLSGGWSRHALVTLLACLTLCCQIRGGGSAGAGGVREGHGRNSLRGCGRGGARNKGGPLPDPWTNGRMDKQMELLSAQLMPLLVSPLCWARKNAALAFPLRRQAQLSGADFVFVLAQKPEEKKEREKAPAMVSFEEWKQLQVEQPFYK